MADSDKERIYDRSQGDSSNSTPLILSVIAVVVAVIAVILGAVSLSQKGINNYNFDGSTGNTQSKGGDDEKIWTMSIGHDAARWEYLDEVSGQIKGFDVDIVNAVCVLANKNCRLSADLYQNCWDAEVGEVQRGGQGLYSGWYDACTAWTHSYVRARTFQFTNSFTKLKHAVFVVKPGNPREFNWRDIRGKKIGFIDGFVFDDACLSRETDLVMGADLPVADIVHYNSREALWAAVLAEEIDAAFDGRVNHRNTDTLEVISEDISTCSIAGFGMMLRKDSRMAEWWNPALERLIATTQYRTICNDLREQHGHIPGPDPEDICIGL